MFVEQKTREAVDFLHRRGVAEAEKGLSLDIGMGGFSQELSRLTTVPAREIPYFPLTISPGRREMLLFGTLDGEKVIVQEGRGCLYEGYFHRELAFPIRVLASMGLKRMILVAVVVTVRPEWETGEIIVVEDHIDLTGGSPIRGYLPEEETISRDMSKAYSAELREKSHLTARRCGLTLRSAVMAYVQGPSGPTPAEGRMLATMGADVLSASLAAEVMMAVHLGLEIVVLGLITSLAEKGRGGCYGKGWNAETLTFCRQLLQVI